MATSVVFKSDNTTTADTFGLSWMTMQKRLHGKSRYLYPASIVEYGGRSARKNLQIVIDKTMR